MDTAYTLDNIGKIGAVHGSIAWGIAHGRAFDIEGIRQYGRMLTDADSHEHALNLTISYDCLFDEEGFRFLTPDTLDVYRVGPKYDYMRSERITFIMHNGEIIGRRF